MQKIINTQAQLLHKDPWHVISNKPSNTLKNYSILGIQQLTDALILPEYWGVLISGETDLETVLSYLPLVSLVMIEFPSFMDGRGFSTASMIREANYQKDLRASGHYMPDQLNYLSRVGFSSFQLAENCSVETAARCLGAFSSSYQQDQNHPLPGFRRRSV